MRRYVQALTSFLRRLLLKRPSSASMKSWGRCCSEEDASVERRLDLSGRITQVRMLHIKEKINISTYLDEVKVDGFHPSALPTVLK
jgi:hypothetical protein